MLPSWTIMPFGTWRRVWDVAMIVVATFTLLHEPMVQLFFDGQGQWNGITFCMDVFTLLEAPVNALTAFTTPHQTVIYKPRTLMRHYFRSKRWWFGGTALLVCVLGRVPRVWGFVMCLRLLRVVRLLWPGEGSTYAEHFELVGSHNAARITILFVGILIFNNLLACIFRHMWLHWRSTPDLYPALYDYHHDADVLVWLATFRLTLAMLVAGEISPCDGIAENLFGVTVSMCTLIVISLVIGECSTLMSYLRRDELEFQSKVERMRSFLSRRRISTKVTNDVIEFVRHCFENDIVYDAHLMAQLPSALVYSLRSEMLGDIGARVPLFRGADPDYVRCVLVKLSYRFFFASDLIYHHGDIDQRMFFILNGRVSLTNLENKVLTVIEDGGHFGESGVLESPHSRPLSARALVYSDCCFIHRDALMNIHKLFPSQHDRLERIAARRRSQNNKGMWYNDNVVTENAILRCDASNHTTDDDDIPLKFFASELKRMHEERNVLRAQSKVLLKRDAQRVVRARAASVVSRLSVIGALSPNTVAIVPAGAS